ncbi:hypothetical protein Tco_1085978 [Tanacetum coccineum]
MLLAMKDEARGNLNEEENDFMLDNAYGDDTLEELSAVVIMMAHIQPADDKADAEPNYGVEAISEVNASQINLISGMLSKGVHEHTNHDKLKAVINTSDDDEIDYNIIFDDPYMENNGGTDEHNSNAHDQIETLDDAEESRLKMKNKMIQLYYDKLNALYETFVVQKEISIEQTFVSTPSTSNVSFESSIYL